LKGERMIRNTDYTNGYHDGYCHGQEVMKAHQDETIKKLTEALEKCLDINERYLTDDDTDPSNLMDSIIREALKQAGIGDSDE
jgi:3-oxoacyl-[acyl-carrier-protein] synthase III